MILKQIEPIAYSLYKDVLLNMLSKQYFSIIEDLLITHEYFLSRKNERKHMILLLRKL